MTRRSRLLAVLPSLLAAALAHCGGTSDPTPASPGESIVANAGCAGCHGGNLAGGDMALPGTMAYAPNLTSDMETGIGGWTDDQIFNAIRNGTDDEGEALCAAMPRYSTFSNDEVSAIVAYLRALPAVSHQSPESLCDEPDPDAGTDAGPQDTGVDVPVVDVPVVDVPAVDVPGVDVPVGDVPRVDVPAVDTGVDASMDVPARDTGADVAVDARPDAVMDAGVDVPRDTGADVRTDAAMDAGLDARADVQTDTGADVRTDAGTDARADVPVDAPPLGCHPVINELVTGVTGAATHEWIELYNPCTAAISLAGWRLGYRSATNATAITGADSSTLLAIGTLSIPAGGFLVFANTGYTGTVDGRLGSGMADAGGGIALRNLAGTVVDSLGWGTATNAFVRVHAAATAAVAAAPGNSLQRRPDGADTGNNQADFHAATRPTPRAANL